ncbi:protein tyrosine phosphatase U1 [Microplitis demolitor]|uniref:tyrosine-protein phosphatase non-receptor type 9 n=1 Tax=Microplitis demolitor TaxID=69319 RepID=UPI000440035B|nr:tyrosine-protein phosphatase non-receptor type 9 [Microplitis demolitor]KAG6558344.1 protein tyrosine phosphatase U1 [Microplitis demolitor]
MGCSNSKSLNRAEFIKLMRRKNTTEILRKEYYQIRREESNFYGGFDACRRKENKSKNREESMLCYEHSRVILPIEDNAGDYINANYVDGWKQKRKFICTQGPLKNTAADFWRLIMMHRTRIIVMLCEASESDDKVCYRYWNSDKEVKRIGKFKIQTVDIMSAPHYTVTVLSVSDGTTSSDGTELFHEVIHFAYQKWSNVATFQGSIEFTDFILAIRRVHKAFKKDLLENNYSSYKPPIVVHCNCGLCRTAVFCAMDISISEYLSNGTISLSQTVINIRKQRFNCFCCVNDYLFYNVLMFTYITVVSVKKYHKQQSL